MSLELEEAAAMAGVFKPIRRSTVSDVGSNRLVDKILLLVPAVAGADIPEDLV